MKRTILAISDGWASGTGFSEELRNVLFRLSQDKNFDINWLALQHMGFPVTLPDTLFSDLPHRNGKVKVYGNFGNPMTYGADAFRKHYANINPELVLFMGY